MYGSQNRRHLETRCQEIGEYVVNNRCTVRAAAKVFRVSKSTVHKDITERLLEINQGLYYEVRDVLDYNKSVRHINGGNATRAKYLKK